MTHIRFLSVCSGIEAASVAFGPLGWQAAGFAEIDRAASEVLAHRYGANMPGEPLARNGVPNFGDFTAIDVSALGRVDVLCGGTPCQAFSVAGKRLSLADARGNLTLSFAVLAHDLARSNGLRNAVWENVPGCLSTKDNAFGCFLGSLVGADDAILPCARPRAEKSNDFWRWHKGGKYPVLDDDGEETGEYTIIEPCHIAKWPGVGMAAGGGVRLAWRVFDAQYFGLAQRRKRVFVICDFGNGADPAKVLFERQGVFGNHPPRRQTGEGAAGTLSARAQGGGGLGTDFDLDGGLQAIAFGGNRGSGPVDIAAALNAHGGPAGRIDFESETFVAHALRAEGFDASEDGTGRGTPLVPCFAIQERAVAENPASGPGGLGVQEGVAYTLEARHHVQAVAFRSSGNNGAWETGDRVDALNTGTDPASHIIAFASKDHGADAGSIAPTLRGMGHAESHANGGGQVAIAFDTTQITSAVNRSNPQPGDPCHPLAAGAHARAVAFDLRGREGGEDQSTQPRWAVRRLTPREAERLQGFPDDYTRAHGQADGPRYKQLGNSWAVPVARWIGARIDAELRS